MTVTKQNVCSPHPTLANCRLCPRNCDIDRQSGATGPCGLADSPRLASWRPLFADESFICGSRGSGALFLSGCTHACVFCQNFDINLRGKGRDVDVPTLARVMLQLQNHGCHNIHWITPTQQLPWLVESLALARAQGLTLPLVYNTGGYESVDVLRSMDGLVDIYLPDFKFWNEELAWKYVRVRDYPTHAMNAILEMHRQVGPLQLDAEGVVTRGLALRHLVMPGCLEDSKRVLHWILDNLGSTVHLNIMPQYKPVHRASRHTGIDRHIHQSEWSEVMDYATTLGFTNLYRYHPPQPALPPRHAGISA